MLEAGVARANITPPLDIPSGLWMAQKHVLPEGLHQELWVTALAIKDGNQEIIMLDFDLVMLSDPQTVAIREAVAAAAGIQSSQVFPFCTHSHAGPITQDFYKGVNADRVQGYIASLPGFAAGAARQAMLNLTSVRIAAGKGDSDIGINRDLPLENGRIVAGPNPEGFCDRDVDIIRLDKEDGSPYVCILNYACHPTVLGPANKLISPDYPGNAKRTVEQATGATCFFLQGAAGNIGPIEGFVGDAAVAERLGSRLGLEAAKVFLGINTSSTRRKLHEVIESGAPLTQYIDEPVERAPDTLRVLSRMLKLPVRDPLPEVFELADERLARWEQELRQEQETGGALETTSLLHQRIEREQLRIDRRKQYKSLPYREVEMHAIAIGPIAILAMWGEPYAEIGAEVKRRSSWAHTLFAAYLGGDPTYIGTAEMYLPQPPFEIENCPFAPEAAETAIEGALDLLNELYANQG